MVNAGLRDDAAALPMTGADGIGLFRTEFQFLVSATLPGRERQQRLYTQGARSGRRPAGRLPHRRHRRRQGAALSRPTTHDESRESGDGLARAAARARPLDADEGAGARADRGRRRQGRCSVMFPMVSEPWEYEEARALFEEQVDWARKAQPQAAERDRVTARCSKCRASPKCSTCCCRGVDFLSIGTNDLTQFLFAADRSDPRLAAALRLAEPGDPALPEARARRRPRGQACRSASAARWAGGRSRRWR